MKQKHDDSTVLSREYLERRVIVVTDDDVVAAIREAESRSASDNSVSVTVVADVADLAVTLLLGPIVDLAVESIKAWKRAKERGLPILYVGLSEAADLAFPPGHPRAGVVYVGHPAMPEVYYTMADFHRVTFEHKFSEAIDLLMHLGATTIRVEHLRGWAQQFASRLSVAMREVDADATAGAERQSQARLLYEATLSGTDKPRLPESRVWYEHEPTWQSIAKGRLEFGLQQFSLNVTYEDDYGVNAGLKASALKAGFELGGQFEDHSATTWKLSGEFT